MTNALGAIVVGVLAVAVLTAAVPYILDASIDDSKHDVQVSNETWTPTTGSVTTLENSHLDRAVYEESVTVRNDTGATMTEGSDYEWYETNGTVEALSGGDLDGASSAEIDYGWHGQTKRQERLTDIQVDATGILVPVSVFAFAMLLLVVAGGMGAL